MQMYVGTRYFRIWRAAVGALAGIGVLTALVFIAPGPNLAAFVLAAFMSGAIFVGLGLSRELPPADVFRAAPRWAAAGGGCGLAIIGYGAAVGLEVLLLLLLIAGTAPPVVAWLGWLTVASETEPVQPRPARRPATQVTQQQSEELDLPELEATDQLGDMTAAELCLAWRRSFSELQRRSDHWSATIEVRRAYLDELERRYPDEFAAWIASGPRAASDPARFFNHGVDH
ncbi:hypothetical protein OG474_28430 [Kribbella sp. NBC_01505]|uniref:FUSC family protein n=1 Tax=Kribbella sp. NBC_01505 TaxID=2903580 RepID=UPI003865C9EA